MHRTWKDQAGQSSVEFVLVLPILLLLTFGTIELGLFLQRQLVMSGAGFIAARAAAVSGPESGAAVRETLGTFAQESQAPWLAQVVSGETGAVKATKNDDERWVKIMVQKKDSWTGLVAGASRALGGGLDPEVRLAASVLLNQEFVPGDGARSATRAFTHNMIDYRTKLGNLEAVGDKLSPLTPWLNRLPGVGNRAASLAYALDPTRQAVAANPRRQWSQENRYAGDWYLDRQAEEPATISRLGPGAGNGLGQSIRLYQGLKDYQALANWIYAFKQAGSVDPTVATTVNALTTTAAALDRTVMSPVTSGLQLAVEGTIFQTKARP